MKTREDYKSALEAAYKRWNELIITVSEEKWKSVLEGYNWTLKDIFAHLMSWMQVSNARLSAGLLEVEPEYPKWLQGGDPDTDSDDLTNTYNARIYETYHKVPRKLVLDSWRDEFLTLIKTIDDLSDEALFQVDAFLWLPGYALKEVLNGVIEHHEEHDDDHLKTVLKH